MTETARLVAASPSCVETAFGEGIVLLDLGDNTCFRLNAVSTIVWRALPQAGTGAVPVDDLVARVTDTFAVDEARCRADVERLVGLMAERGLVRVEETSTSAAEDAHAPAVAP
ncbi:PqqD family protein [Salinarimonas ramus]|uniref:Coenzyme PQQ synthesis protein D (PqqD) n=1 Tax=Salinarimonas ramus TaxID=690164 RepID=A0A917Q9S0_9HYPH|nr:PqqD family protein [Salinarimonas ramus]GGK37731.1 hypothetical protein GCM10011322_25960 [Salinarimonas ramus]